MTRRPALLKWLLPVVVVVTFAALVLALVIPPERAQPITVTAQFEDTIGLYEGNAVSVLGMPVGKVTKIAPKNGFVEVKLSVDKDVDLPVNVQAVTVSTSILTDRHIELTPPYHSGPKLMNGDVLMLSRTRTPVEFDRTLAMADKLSRSLGGNGQGQGPVTDLIGIGSTVASRSGADIKAALDQLSSALRLGSDNGTTTKKDIQSIATNLAGLTQSAADNDTAIRDFGSSVGRLSEMVAAERLGTGDTGAGLNQILDQATSLLEANRGGLKDTLTNFQTLMGAVQNSRRDMAETLDLLPLLAGNISNAVDTNAHALRMHVTIDKLLADGQMIKEVCNLAGIKDLGCATGTIADLGPAFGAKFFADGMTGLLSNIAGGN